MFHKFLPKFLVMPYLSMLYSFTMRSWCREAGGDMTNLQMTAVAAGTASTYIIDHINDAGFYSTSNLVSYMQLSFFMPIAVVCAYIDTHIFTSFLKCITLAFFYDVRMPYFNVKIKSLFPYSKTLFVPFMHVYWCMTISQTSFDVPFVYMFLYYVFLNIIMDIKDIHDDYEKGVVTIPNTIGHQPTVFWISVCCLVSGIIISLDSMSASLCILMFGTHLFSYYLCEKLPNEILYYFDLYRIATLIF
jgi:hypothetical protein